MKKERILKYLILIYVMIGSFFLFVSNEVSALEYSVNDNKITLSLSMVDESDSTKGYVIEGATTTCSEEDSFCIKNWSIPSSYSDGNPIVAIKDSDNNENGVLEGLSTVIAGAIYGGENLQYIGQCAFCNFSNVTEYVLGEKLESIGEYAFANNSSLKTIYINAYDNNIRTALVNTNAFSSSSLEKIVFNNQMVAETYESEVSGWSEVSDLLTHKIVYSINDGKVSLILVSVDLSAPTSGYIIEGATTICVSGDTSCIENWTIPANYSDGNPIVEIKGSYSSVRGVLQNLSSVISGVVETGANLQYIGQCAFCNFFNVNEYVLGESVEYIAEYAFSNNRDLEIINIKAYNNGIRTVLASTNAFNASYSLENIVFANKTIADTYKSSVSGWNEVSIPFTYKITYRFYNGDNLVDSFLVYSGVKIGQVPKAIELTGFYFNWVAKTSESIKITADSLATYTSIDPTLGPIYDVVAKWDLKESKVYIETKHNGNVIEHTSNSKKIEIEYAGKNQVLYIDAIVEHELKDDPKFAIDYSWSKDVSGIIYDDISITSGVEAIRVADSGTYKCTITSNYTGYPSIIQMVEIIVNITPRDLIVKVKDREIEYGYYLEEVYDSEGIYYQVDESTPLAQGENIQNFKFKGTDQNYDIGTLNDVLEGEVTFIGYTSDLTNYAGDYRIEYVKGNLEITPRTMIASLNNNIVIEYGNNEYLVKEITEIIYDQEITLKLQYVRDNVVNRNVGTYDVIDANIIDNLGEIDENYEVTFDISSVGKVVIVARIVEVDWDISDNLVYSGIEKQATASYKTIDNHDIKLDVEIIKNSQESPLINAGTYNLSASMIVDDDNYTLINYQKEVIIEKADSVFIGDQIQRTTYNGLPQRVTVGLNNSEGKIVYGDYSSCKNAHLSSSTTCLISVSVAETENYKGIEGNFKLHIEPYKLEVSPNLFEFTYGSAIEQGDLHMSIDGVNNEKVGVGFAKDGHLHDIILDVGYYDIVSATVYNTNYKISMIANSGLNKIKINPAPIKIKFLYYENLVYDGNIKKIDVRYYGTEESLDLVLDYCGKSDIKNAGDYRINVSLTNNNYYISGNDYLEFSIAKATYDVSNIKLSDKKVRFNFNNHFINLEGELPNGLKAVYTINGRKGNGTYLPFKHTVKVSFEGDYNNYNYVDPLEATLNVDMSWIWITLTLVLVVGIGIPLGIYLLLKYEIIEIKQPYRSRVRKILKIKKELDELNEFFKQKRDCAQAKDESNEITQIEEPVKFIKKQANKEPEVLIPLSFVDKLFKSSYGTKQIYSEVKNELLSYAGIVSKIKRDYETFYLNNVPIAKLNIIDGNLITYFALDPTQYKSEEYNHVDASKEKDFSAVPLKLIVTSIESLRFAKMFIRIIRKREGIKTVSNFIRTDYVSVYTAKEESFKLFKKVFVKKDKEEENRFD